MQLSRAASLRTELVQARGLVVLAVLVLATTGACGKTAEKNECRTTLDQSGCAATFDLQVGTVLGYFPHYLCAHAGACGAYRVWDITDMMSYTCVYDSSGQQLLSAASCSDVGICDYDQFCEYAGQTVDLSKSCDPSTLPTVCPITDAGND